MPTGLTKGPTRPSGAAVDDLRRGLSPPFLNDLAKAARAPELFAREAIDRLCQRQLEPFTLRAAAHMKRAAEQGASTGQAIADGIAAALRESANAQLRNTDGYLARRFPRERTDIMARLQESVRSIDFDAFGASAARGLVPKLERRERRLDLDSDLRSQQ